MDSLKGVLEDWLRRTLSMYLASPGKGSQDPVTLKQRRGDACNLTIRFPRLLVLSSIRDSGGSELLSCIYTAKKAVYIILGSNE